MRDRRQSRPVELDNSATSALLPTTMLGPVEKVGTVATELVEEHAALLAGLSSSRVVAVEAGEVEQQHEDLGPFDVPENGDRDRGRPPRLDEPGDVGQHELVPARPHDAEVCSSVVNG